MVDNICPSIYSVYSVPLSPPEEKKPIALMKNIHILATDIIPHPDRSDSLSIYRTMQKILTFKTTMINQSITFMKKEKVKCKNIRNKSRTQQMQIVVAKK